jgi:hypothetical protein
MAEGEKEIKTFISIKQIEFPYLEQGERPATPDTSIGVHFP